MPDTSMKSETQAATTKHAYFCGEAPALPLGKARRCLGHLDCHQGHIIVDDDLAIEMFRRD